MTCYKCHRLARWAALFLWDPRATSSSAKPSLMVVQWDWSSPLQSALLLQITITGLEPRVQLDVADRPENFLVDTGATYSVLTSYFGAYSSQTCTILGATEKTITKRLTRALLCYWEGKIFCHQFPVVPECPTPFWGRDILTKLETTCDGKLFSP